jgi:hypothetical protein
MTGRIQLKGFMSHSTIFCAGKNFKSDTWHVATPDINLSYDIIEDKLYLKYKGNLRILNSATVASWEPLNYADVINDAELGLLASEKPVKALPTITNPGPIKAQVSVPHEQVQNPPTRRSVKQ